MSDQFEVGIALGLLLQLDAERHQNSDVPPPPEDPQPQRLLAVLRRLRRWRGMLSDWMRYGEICWEHMEVYDGVQARPTV